MFMQSDCVRAVGYGSVQYSRRGVVDWAAITVVSVSASIPAPPPAPPSCLLCLRPFSRAYTATLTGAFSFFVYLYVSSFSFVSCQAESVQGPPRDPLRGRRIGIQELLGRGLVRHRRGVPVPRQGHPAG